MTPSESLLYYTEQVEVAKLNCKTAEFTRLKKNIRNYIQVLTRTVNIESMEENNNLQMCIRNLRYLYADCCYFEKVL